MDTPRIHSRLYVDRILRRWPQAAAVFIQAKTACVGCPLSRFCTLEDVASYYKLRVETLVERLQENVQTTQTLNRGVKNEVVV